MNEERRAAVERMFRARVSWTLLAGVGLMGLTRGLSLGVRGVLLGAAVGAFIWLNRPLAIWLMRAREVGDPRWRPMAIGMALRVVGLAAVIAVAW